MVYSFNVGRSQEMFVSLKIPGDEKKNEWDWSITWKLSFGKKTEPCRTTLITLQKPPKSPTAPQNFWAEGHWRLYWGPKDRKQSLPPTSIWLHDWQSSQIRIYHGKKQSDQKHRLVVWWQSSANFFCCKNSREHPQKASRASRIELGKSCFLTLNYFF